MSAAECTAAVGGRLIAGSENTVFTSVSIDTRTLQAGALYFAIPGPRFDGHDFVDRSLQQGAAGAVVSRDMSGPERAVLIEVPDTSRALLRLAAYHRRLWGRRLACITGSAGKTTTKEILARLLETKYAVHKSPGNFNNIFGLSQALLGLDASHEIAVVEIGMNTPGEIALLATAADPDLGLLTNVVPVHLEYFPSIDAIAEAKGELIDAMKRSGTVVYNADDHRVAELAHRFKGHKFSFGIVSDADLVAESLESRGLEGSSFVLRNGRDFAKIRLMLPGVHNVRNFLAAAAAAMAWGVSLGEVVAAASQVRTESHRGAVLRFQDGFTVVDDSYNSNPSAMSCMLDLVRETSGYGRKILVAGEMLELGADAERFHAEVGQMAVRSGVDLIIGVRGEARSICRGATDAGMNPAQALFFETVDAAAGELCMQLRQGDLALVKGSHGVGLESLIARLCSCFNQMPAADSGGRTQ